MFGDYNNEEYEFQPNLIYLNDLYFKKKFYGVRPINW